MDQHYSAFISYKHAPLDIEVAKEVQSRLEHYVIPTVMAKKLGRKKIGRIFRDQEELPITVDLSKDINRALEDADFLIVICSKSTKLSTWVPREIATFLKNHDQSHVLTVLAEGEPSEVIPEILLRSQEDDTALEPLSCDYRGNRRQVRKTEIPRLAAALLGCSYDELVMRERQYKRRRITVFASVAGVLAAGAISYLIWSNMQINKNYQLAQKNYRLAQENYQKAEENRIRAEENYSMAEENRIQAEENYRHALKNQSEYLSHESIRALNAGDRRLGIQLALAALPIEIPDRPLTSAAQNALVESIRAYLPSVNTSVDITSVWSYETQNEITSFLISGDNVTLYATDLTGNLYGWDVEERKALFTQSFPDGIDKVFTDNENRLFVQKGSTLWSVDPRDGTVLWRFDDTSALSAPADVGSADAYRHVRAGYFPVPEGLLCLVSEDQYVYDEDYNAIHTYWYGVKLLDPENGSLKSEGGWVEAASPANSFGDFTVSADGTRAAIGAPYYEDNLSAILLVDLERLSLQIIPPAFDLYNVAGLSFTDDNGTLLYHGLKVGEDGSLPGGGYSLFTLQMLTPADNVVVCMDLSTLRPVWHASFRSGELDRIDPRASGFLLHPEEGSEDPRQAYAVICGSTVYSYAPEDGTLYSQITYSSGIVGYIEKTACAQSLSLLLNGGAMAMAYPLENNGSIFPLNTFSCEFLQALHTKKPGWYAILARTGDRTITQLGKLKDDSFQAFADQTHSKELPLQHAQLKDYIVALNDTLSINIISLTEDRQTRNVPLSGFCSSVYDVDFVGADEAEESFYFTADVAVHTIHLYRLDLGTGAVTDLTPKPLSDEYRDRYVDCDGRLFYFSTNVLGGLCPVTPEGDRLTVGSPIALPDTLSAAYGNRILTAGHWVLIQAEGEGDDYNVAVVDVDTGKVQSLSLPLGSDAVGFAAKEDGSLFALCSKEITVVFDAENQICFTLTPDTGSYQSVCFSPAVDDGLPARLLLMKKGGATEGVLVYDPDSGELLSSIPLSYNVVKYYRWDFDGSLLYLTAGHFEYMWVLDLKENAVQCTLSYCGGWDRSRDRFLGILPAPGVDHDLGWYPHYTWQELVAKAEEYLHGAEMDAGIRAQYGLTAR